MFWFRIDEAICMFMKSDILAPLTHSIADLPICLELSGLEANIAF